MHNQAVKLPGKRSAFKVYAVGVVLSGTYKLVNL